VEIDITDDKNKIYYNDIKKVMSNYTINEANNTNNYTSHQIIKILDTYIYTSDDNLNKTLETNLLIREIPSSDYFIFKIFNMYKEDEFTSNVVHNKNYTMFNPQEIENKENFLNLFKRFLVYKNLTEEYVFYKGNKKHSCSNNTINLNSNESNYLMICNLKQRNSNYTFEMGILDTTPQLLKNISDYRDIYYFNNKDEIFENFISKNDNKLSNFTIVEKETQIMFNYYNFMKENKIVPENIFVNQNDNDDSEGGFNLITRRSLLGIVITGVICSIVYIGLFVLGKMNKRRHTDFYDSIEEN